MRWLKDKVWIVFARFPQSWIPIVENQLSSEYQLWRWKVARNSYISWRQISDSNGRNVAVLENSVMSKFELQDSKFELKDAMKSLYLKVDENEKISVRYEEGYRRDG